MANTKDFRDRIDDSGRKFCPDIRYRAAGEQRATEVAQAGWASKIRIPVDGAENDPAPVRVVNRITSGHVTRRCRHAIDAPG